MEQINDGLLLPPGACGKYDVSRSLEGAPSVFEAEAGRAEGVQPEPVKGLLDAA